MSDVNIEASVVKVDAGDLPESANLLIEKISRAVGGVLAPWQIVRMAKAEAAAALIRTKSGVQVTQLQRRMAARILDEETQRQMVIEQVTAKAIPLLIATADPSQMDDDWTRNFFEKVRIISNEQMQTLWSRVLAGEANAPGTFSKRTINILSDLDASDARSFSSLGNFTWSFGPLVTNLHHKIYPINGITKDALRHLESLGLIFNLDMVEKSVTIGGIGLAPVEYQGRKLWIGTRDGSGWATSTGQIIFTRSGRELLQACKQTPVEGYWEHVLETWGSIFKTEQEPKGECSPVVIL